MRILNNIAIFLIRGLRPLLGPAVCKFDFSCTQYAVQQLKTESFFKAVKAISIRLCNCSPLQKLCSKLT